MTLHRRWPTTIDEMSESEPSKSSMPESVRNERQLPLFIVFRIFYLRPKWPWTTQIDQYWSNHEELRKILTPLAKRVRWCKTTLPCRHGRRSEKTQNYSFANTCAIVCNEAKVKTPCPVNHGPRRQKRTSYDAVAQTSAVMQNYSTAHRTVIDEKLSCPWRHKTTLPRALAKSSQVTLSNENIPFEAQRPNEPWTINLRLRPQWRWATGLREHVRRSEMTLN